ncbi:MAG: phenylacetate--CoA ligase [Alcaligenaceae bacterium]|nr:phenylacetate--CoA ligase [Alcaligenaceae bacterium]
MSNYYEDREAAPEGDRERDLFNRLPQALEQARARAPAIEQQLQGIHLQALRSRSDLQAIPVVRKSELLKAQTEARHAASPETPVVSRVFGGFSAIGWGAVARVFASPGPIYEPESKRPDYWGFARALHAAGFRPGHLVHNCFSYHFTPAGSMMETAAHALGCSVFPGGVGQTEQQVQAMADLRPDGYTGTPSFLKIILEKADEMGVSLPSVKRALFSGEAFPPSLCRWFAERGVQGYQAYGSADLGMMAFETEARDGLVINEDIILEIVRPGTSLAVPDGEVGEVVVTTLNPDYPLVRFGTGDLSAILPGVSPCGRSNRRIKGWMGRADQTTKVRGMFVHPGQVAGLLKRHPELIKVRLEVQGRIGADLMVLKVETAQASPDLQARVADSAREVTKLRADVVCVEPGSLPNDGKLIDDQRNYD